MRKIINKLIKYFKQNPRKKRIVISILQFLKLHKFALKSYGFLTSLKYGVYNGWLLESEFRFLNDRAFEDYGNSLKYLEEEFSLILDKKEADVILSNPKVDVITALYRSDEFIAKFLINAMEQKNFTSFQFNIVSCDPSKYEKNLLSKFTDKFSNCQVTFISAKIGIYKAWNEAINSSRADFITNWNVDDARRFDSIDCQMRFFEIHDYCDVVYQDLFIYSKPNLSWNEIVDKYPKTNFGAVSFGSLMSGLNYPHNGPMWKRQLHYDLGYFDETLTSSGDYDFWIRCSLAGKLFLKSRDAHVSYYLNPKGLSTKKNSKGVAESKKIQNQYVEHLANTRTSPSPKYGNLKHDAFSYYIEVLNEINSEIHT